MNDATELEPSLAGAIDFFQNLHHKMGTLETDTSAWHDQLQTLSDTLTTLGQDRQSDQQILVTLSSDLSAQDARLTKLQSANQALDKQLTTVETLVARFQEEQQEVRQALATLSSDLRQELQSILTHQAEPVERVSALESRLASQTREQLSLLGALQTLEKGAGAVQARMTALESRIEQHQEQFEPLEKADRNHQQHLEEFSSIVEAQHKRLLQLEITLENLDQGAQSTTQLLNTLKTDLKRHEQALASLDQVAEASETATRQLQDQQSRLDHLTESSSATRKEIVSLKTRFEEQRQGLTDAARTRQELQKQQERVKHLETLVGKVSADTNSTRQILNVLQTDLTTQNDTLRELDQSWRDSLSSHHDRLSQLEGAYSSPTAPTEEALPVEPAGKATLEPARFEALEQALAGTREQYEALRTPLDELRQTLTTQGEKLDETQELAWSQIQNLQERLSEAEATLDSLHAAPVVEPDTGAETETTALSSLRQDLATQAETLEETQELAWSQIQNLQERLSEAEATLDSLYATSAAESTGDAETETALNSLRQDLTAQAETLEETQELAWSQIQNLQERLSEAEATLDQLGQAPVETGAGPDLEAVLAPLRQELSTHADALNALRDATQQQFAALNDALEIRQQESREIAGQVGQLQTVTLEELRQAGQAQIQQIQALQHRLDATEATLDILRQAPEPGVGIDLEAVLGPLRQDLLAQTGDLDKLRDITQQQLADLSAALETRQQEALETASQLGVLQQEIEKLQHPPTADNTAFEQRLETVEVYSRKLQEDLAEVEETVTALESRLSSQSQAFSGNFEQFRALNTEIHALQQKIGHLETPQQLGDIDQELAAYQQDIAQLREAVEQIQADSQQMGEMIQQGGAESPAAELTARLDEQQERLNELAATVETVRADAKSAQETVVTMATNVAKRIHEIQNLLVATETAQGERLQDVEQKLIWLQAAMETMDSQKTKPRRWFSMPASLTSVLLTVSAGGAAILAQVMWTLH
jgi:chromosome segregation ATPase